MKIYSMTATFGKLEHATLTLQPGMNIVEAPNEWGKTTWCAFLTAMLYGIDTKIKSTKAALADKERFAPWSGSPMSGRMDINWNGRDITIERSSKGRSPMGVFRAYETQSGLPVPELDANNCGQQLLRVERSVFLQAGFVRAGDLSITQDEALRARLNALVTTGDDSGDAERLAKALKDLKNRCRYNRTGLLPQAEQEKQALEQKIATLEDLELQCARQTQRIEEIRREIDALNNHAAHLAYQANVERSRRIAQAEEASRQAAGRLQAQQECCASLPAREDARQMLNTLRQLDQQMQLLQLEETMAPAPQPQPTAPPVFRGLAPAQAAVQAKADAEVYSEQIRKKPLAAIAGGVILILGIVAALRFLVPGIAAAAAGAAVLLAGIVHHRRIRRKAEDLANRYGSRESGQWIALAENWAAAVALWQESQTRQQEARAAAAAKFRTLQQQLHTITGGTSAAEAEARLEAAIKAWDQLELLQRDAKQAEAHHLALAAMATAGEKPETEDQLTDSPVRTQQRLAEAQASLAALSGRLHQNRGLMEALGDKVALQSAADKVSRRIARLEDLYAALTIALQNLEEASAQLQRRFAPKIARHAQALMTAFTGGRYDRLTLAGDLAIHSGAEKEDTLHDILWRSSGTADQLQLAVRMAVAEALVPHAPLILDDALVRFDDTRLCAALQVLQDVSAQKQVILFTCQSRENSLLNP